LLSGLRDGSENLDLNSDATFLEELDNNEATAYEGVHFEAGANYTSHAYMPFTQLQNFTDPQTIEEHATASNISEASSRKPYREIFPSHHTEDQLG
jgi:hypothetical protein